MYNAYIYNIYKLLGNTCSCGGVTTIIKMWKSLKRKTVWS